MQVLQEKAKDDFYLFSKFVCKHSLLEEKPHREIADMLTKNPDLTEWAKMTREGRSKNAVSKKLLMVPRGCFKTTMAGIDLPLWLSWHDPNIRIMLDSESMQTSKKFIGEMQGILNDSLFQAIVCDDKGDPLLTPDKNTAGGLTEKSLIWKHRTIPAKEPSIFATGADTAVTGLHPDIIIMDDLVSERNVTTKEQIEKVKQHYRLAFSLLEPGGILILIGTRYHMYDLYSEVIQDLSYDMYYRPAVDDNGELFFPTRLGHERLEDLRRTQGAKVFNSQYMLNPINEEDAVFQDDWIQYYDEGDLIGKKLNTFINVDPAISEKNTADPSAITVYSVDAETNIYIREYVNGRMNPHEMFDHIFRLSDKYRVMKVGIEVVAFQRALIFFIKQQMRSRGKMLSIVELKAANSKIHRAHAFQPYVENGMFYIKKEMRELKNQMLEFPLGRHDDLVDTITYIPQNMRKPSKADNEKRPSVSYVSDNRAGY